jgi:formylglycine-generating enzyme required for sulfatase activity/nucleoside phosphorylase
MAMPPTDRLGLINALNGLPLVQFNALVFELKPPDGLMPPPMASQGDRVFALVSWAESYGGCGLPRLQQVLDQILTHQTQPPSNNHTIPATATGTTGTTEETPDTPPRNEQSILKGAKVGGSVNIGSIHQTVNHQTSGTGSVNIGGNVSGTLIVTGSGNHIVTGTQQAPTSTRPSTSSSSRADVLLVTVTTVETRAVFDVAKERTGKEAQRIFEGNKTYYDLGIIGGARTWLVRSEMGAGGSGGALLTVADGIRVLSPDAVIMVGIAFGVDQDKQPIGKVLISRQILDYDLQKVGTASDGTTQIRIRGDRPQASTRLLDRSRDGEYGWSGVEPEFGLMLSGPKLIDNINFRDQLLEIEPEAIGGEMEGAGLYAAAAAQKVDWIMVKAVCDYADGHKRENKEERQKLAANNAAGFVFHVIAQGGLVGARPVDQLIDSLENLGTAPSVGFTGRVRSAISARAEVSEVSTVTNIEVAYYLYGDRNYLGSAGDPIRFQRKLVDMAWSISECLPDLEMIGQVFPDFQRLDLLKLWTNYSFADRSRRGDLVGLLRVELAAHLQIDNPGSSTVNFELLPSVGKPWRSVQNWEQGRIIYDLKVQDDQGLVALEGGKSVLLPLRLVVYVAGAISRDRDGLRLLALGQALASAIGACEVHEDVASKRFTLNRLQADIEFADGENTTLSFDVIVSKGLGSIPPVRKVDFEAISMAWDRIEAAAVPSLSQVLALEMEALEVEAGFDLMPSPLPAQPKTVQSTPKPTFTFEVVTVDAKGNITDRRAGEAEYRRENISKEVILDLVLIPGGTFLMGSPANNEDEQLDGEGPQHQVTVPQFFMGRNPITQAQWKVVAAMPKVQRDLNADISYFKGDNRPVENVSWYDAVEFCKRLTNHTNRQYRLPSEAEWEYACRAGTSTPFHFGKTIKTDLANYRGTDFFRDHEDHRGFYDSGPRGEYREETTPVDHFKTANAFGLSDIHGNVWEWCADRWHENYEGAPTDGSVWQNGSKEEQYIMRGGSWLYGPKNCRSARRRGEPPNIEYYNSGFRVCCSYS